MQLTATGREHFLFAGCEDAPEYHFANSEYVTAPPVGAVVLATREELPAAALDHGGNWYSVQFHPEACPGPSDAAGVFDKFSTLMERSSSRAPA